MSKVLLGPISPTDNTTSGQSNGLMGNVSKRNFLLDADSEAAKVHMQAENGNRILLS
ncbi:Beta-galactosidase 2, partial [Clarias magur]